MVEIILFSQSMVSAFKFILGVIHGIILSKSLVIAQLLKQERKRTSHLPAVMTVLGALNEGLIHQSTPTPAVAVKVTYRINFAAHRDHTP